MSRKKDESEVLDSEVKNGKSRLQLDLSPQHREDMTNLKHDLGISTDKELFTRAMRLMKHVSDMEKLGGVTKTHMPDGEIIRIMLF